VRVSEKTAANAVEIGFEDSGAEYNPLERPDPSIDQSAKDREIGGLGIFLTKKIMDEVRYKYTDGRNILNIRKNL